MNDTLISNKDLRDICNRLSSWSEKKILKNKVVIDLTHTLSIVVDDNVKQLLKLDCVSFVRIGHLMRRSWTAKETIKAFNNDEFYLLLKLVLSYDKMDWYCQHESVCDKIKENCDRALVDFNSQYPNVAKLPSITFDENDLQAQVKEAILQFQRYDPHMVWDLEMKYSLISSYQISPIKYLITGKYFSADLLLDDMQRMFAYMKRKLNKKKNQDLPFSHYRDIAVKYFETCT
jgi:hypothetical protein